MRAEAGHLTHTSKYKFQLMKGVKKKPIVLTDAFTKRGELKWFDQIIEKQKQWSGRIFGSITFPYTASFIKPYRDPVNKMH